MNELSVRDLGVYGIYSVGYESVGILCCKKV